MPGSPWILVIGQNGLGLTVPESKHAVNEYFLHLI